MKLPIVAACTTLLFGAGLAAQQRAPSPPVVSETLAAQVMLDRAGFSTGEIDGRSGSNVKRAAMAFQRAHALPATGQLDDTTWATLREAGLQPLISYTVTDADLAGPFVGAIPADLMQQSKLDILGYTSPLEALAERFHSSPQLLRALNAGASFDRASEVLMVPNVEIFEAPAAPEPAESRGRPAVGTSGRPAAARRGGDTTGVTAPKVTIAVTKSTSALTVEDESGRVIFHAPVTTGSQHDPLPIGTWKVTGVQRNPAFHYHPDLFWDANPAHSKAKIAPGPNNPVGLVWIDISKPHYGIHGTPSPSNIGHVESHGCVRLTNWDVQRVAQWARPGTPVVFRE